MGRVAALVTVLCLAAAASPGALAKGRIVVSIGDRTPRVGQPFPVDLRTGWVVPADDWLRLIAVAPGRGWYAVVGTVTGDSSLAHASIPRDGFALVLRRVGPTRWHAVVRLPRAGRWRLVVPNATHEGFMVPPPAEWMPWVDVHR